MPTKVHIVKAIVFPVVMYGCESCTIKKTECQRIDAFILWCWRRLLRVPWTERRSNQSIVKEINSEYSFEGLMLKLKRQCYDHLSWRVNSLKKTLTLEKNWGQEEKGEKGWDGWVASLIQRTWVWANSGIWWRTKKPSMLESMGLQRVKHNLASEQLCMYICVCVCVYFAYIYAIFFNFFSILRKVAIKKKK